MTQLFYYIQNLVAACWFAPNSRVAGSMAKNSAAEATKSWCICSTRFLALVLVSLLWVSSSWIVFGFGAESGESVCEMRNKKQESGVEITQLWPQVSANLSSRIRGTEREKLQLHFRFLSSLSLSLSRASLCFSLVLQSAKRKTMSNQIYCLANSPTWRLESWLLLLLLLYSCCRLSSLLSSSSSQSSSSS